MERDTRVLMKNKQWVYLGCEYHRWQTLKMKSGISTDIELLTMLLDCYIKLHIKDFRILPVASDLFDPFDKFQKTELGADEVTNIEQKVDLVDLEKDPDQFNHQEIDTKTTKYIKESTENLVKGYEDIIKKQGPSSSFQLRATKVKKTEQETDLEDLENDIDQVNHSEVYEEIDTETTKYAENNMEESFTGSVGDETENMVTGCEDIIIKQEPLSPLSNQDMEHCEDSFIEEGNFMEPQDINQRNNVVMNNTGKSRSSKRKTKTIRTEILGSRRIFYCDLCDHSSHSRGNLYRHRKAIHFKTKISCPICGKLFSQNYYLSQHRRSIHENKKLECNLCPETFNAISSLRRHRMIKHSTEGRYTCEICDAKFYDKNMYEGHCNSHTNAKPYTCLQCKKTFKYKSSLHRHEITCLNPDSERFQCDQCDKTMKTIGSLKAHKRIVHGVKDQICICEKSFTTITALKRHQKTCPEANFGIIKKDCDDEAIAIFL